jgi:hypothetical protein
MAKWEIKRYNWATFEYETVMEHMEENELEAYAEDQELHNDMEIIEAREIK